MDITELTAAGVASSQLGTRQRQALLAIGSAADAQKQVANVLEQAAQDQSRLLSSGPIGTKINTTA